MIFLGSDNNDLSLFVRLVHGFDPRPPHTFTVRFRVSPARRVPVECLTHERGWPETLHGARGCLLDNVLQWSTWPGSGFAH